jgi:hypothetical protein
MAVFDAKTIQAMAREAQTFEERAGKALRAARSLLSDEHFGILDYACPKDNGEPDVSRIDTDFRALRLAWRIR